jgi:excisionase family DNA binding protein
MEEELLDTEQVAEFLGIGQVTVWRWCREGVLPCLKIGRSWRIRRYSLEEFVRQRERPSTLVGRLGSFLTVPDAVIGVVQNRELMHALDAAFFQVGEARGGLLVKFAGGEPETNEEQARADLKRHGLEVTRLEREGRFRISPEPGPIQERADALRDFLDKEAEEGGSRVVWASFDWTVRVDLETALNQQEAMRELTEGNRPLVVKTAVLEEVVGEWPPKVQRRAREVHSGTIWLSESGMAFSRVMPPPTH